MDQALTVYQLSFTVAGPSARLLTIYHSPIYHLPVIGSLRLTIPPFTICQLTNVEAKEMLQDHPRQLPCLCLHSGVFGFNSFQMQEADHSPGYD